MSDDEVPERVRAAEERRAARQAREEYWTVEEAALIKVGAWEARIPGAPEPTEEDLRLAAIELENVSQRLEKPWRCQ